MFFSEINKANKLDLKKNIKYKKYNCEFLKRGSMGLTTFVNGENLGTVVKDLVCKIK